HETGGAGGRRLLAEQVPAGVSDGSDEDEHESGGVQSTAPESCVLPALRARGAFRPFILPGSSAIHPAVHHACGAAGALARPGRLGGPCLTPPSSTCCAMPR